MRSKSIDKSSDVTLAKQIEYLNKMKANLNKESSNFKVNDSLFGLYEKTNLVTTNTSSLKSK